VIGGSGDESTGLDTTLSFYGAKTDEVERDVLKEWPDYGRRDRYGHASGRQQNDIHAPEQPVLDRPMRPNRREQLLGASRQAADVEASFDGCLTLDAALRLDYRKGFQIWPLFGFGQTVPLIESETASNFESAMIHLDGFGCRVWSTLRCHLELGEEVVY